MPRISAWPVISGKAHACTVGRNRGQLCKEAWGWVYTSPPSSLVVPFTPTRCRAQWFHSFHCMFLWLSRHLCSDLQGRPRIPVMGTKTQTASPGQMGCVVVVGSAAVGMNQFPQSLMFPKSQLTSTAGHGHGHGHGHGMLHFRDLHFFFCLAQARKSALVPRLVQLTHTPSLAR